MTRQAWAAVAVLLASAAGACGSIDEPAASTEQNFSINQTSLLLVNGDSAVLVISPVPVEPAVNGTVRWASSRPDVVSIDSLVLIGEPARVRARTAGTATLTATVRSPTRTITASVPVRIGAG